jgi:hypothetical protein
MSEVENPWTATIGQLTPIDSNLLSVEDSVEITVSTRVDGGEGLAKKTYRTSIGAILGIFAARRDNPNQVTAEQVGSYTVQAITDLLREKLGVDDVAVDALKLDGKTRSEIIAEAREGVSYDSQNLGGRPASAYVLVDDYLAGIVEVKEYTDGLGYCLVDIMNDEAQSLGG